MGYSRYDTDRGPAGYAVTDTCHAEDCGEGIDRGLAHLCGPDPHSPAPGCGWWFCPRHLAYTDLGQLCRGCVARIDGADTDTPDPDPDTEE